jgi:hypothetical protein
LPINRTALFIGRRYPGQHALHACHAGLHARR